MKHRWHRFQTVFLSNQPASPLVFPASGFAALLGFLVFQWSIQWEWSVLMNEVYFISFFPKIDSMSQTFLDEVSGYWSHGRFLPVTHLTRILQFHLLPLDPNLFHWLHTGLFLAAVLVGFWGILAEQMKGKIDKLFLLFLLGFAILQRPLLDVTALLSIGEGWVIFFFAGGLLFFPGKSIAYRLLFALCALSKEPGVTVFLASALVHFKHSLQEPSHRRVGCLQGVIDTAIFATWALLLNNYHVREGSYLSSYTLLRLENVQLYFLGLAKMAIGLVPLLAWVGTAWWRNRFSFKEFFQGKDRPLLCGLFAVFYLALVVPMGVPGYLLIPPTFALTLLAGGMAVPIYCRTRLSVRQAALIATLFVLGFCLSVGRYAGFARSINESSLLFQTLLLTAVPRQIVINGYEATVQGNQLAGIHQSPVTVVRADRSADVDVSRLKDGEGDLVLLELTGYFGRFPDEFLQRVESAVGGWDMTVDRKVVRLFYSRAR